VGEVLVISCGEKKDVPDGGKAKNKKTLRGQVEFESGKPPI